MRAVVISRPGGPEVLEWSEVPDPVAGAGRGRSSTSRPARSTGPTSCSARGTTPRRLAPRRTRGWSAPGGSAPWAKASRDGRSGDEVVALLSGGGYAEQVAVAAGQLLPVPAGVDLVTAAALPEATCHRVVERLHAGRAATR